MPIAAFNMEKLAVGPAVPPETVSVANSVEENIRAVAKAPENPVEEVDMTLQT